jgi:DNA modification methylase
MPVPMEQGIGIIDSLNVELRPLSMLKPARRALRKHTDAQIGQIASAIRQFGFINPIIIDAKGQIVAGSGRAAAAESLGMEDVPVISVSHLTEEELRVYALADNKIAMNAGFDEAVLSIEFEELQALQLPFELDLTGFSTTEIDLLSAVDPAEAKLEHVPELDRKAHCGVYKGDLWIMGKHKLLCGDSRDRNSFTRLMGDEQARMVFSDPPFNVPNAGHTGGLGKIQHENFAMASGEMNSRQFGEFLEDAFVNCAAVSMDGAIHYQCMDWRHVEEMMFAGRSAYYELKNICIWAKDNGGMGSFYRSQYEMVFVWKVGTAPHLNTIELGKNGRYRTNVWNYRGATKTGANAELAMHPTVKPVPMIMDAIKDTSKQGEIILDPFGGSGSTLIAAHKAKRRARLIEFDPKYCEVAIRRWEKLTRQKAILKETGETFEEVYKRRSEAFSAMVDAALDEPAWGEIHGD